MFLLVSFFSVTNAGFLNYNYSVVGSWYIYQELDPLKATGHNEDKVNEI